MSVWYNNSSSQRRHRQFEAMFGHHINESHDDSVASPAVPMFSPGTTALRPRAVSFLSPHKDSRSVHGLSTVMYGGGGPSPATSVTTARSRPRPAAEVFYSPHSQVSSIHSASPITHSRNNSNNSHGLERFKETNIAACTSPRELQQIILDLKRQGNFPFLVRTAERRLYALQAASNCPLIQEEEVIDGECKASDHYGGSVSKTAVANMSSLSPKSVTTSLAYSCDDDDEGKHEDNALTPFTASPSQRSPFPALGTSPRVSREQELEQQVEELSQKIVELHQTMRQDKMEFENQIRSIQHAKQVSQQHALNLQSNLDNAHQSAEHVSQQLVDLQATNQTISQQLERERSAHVAFETKTKQVESKLQQKVQELLRQMNLVQESGGKVQELNQLLKNAQTGFEIVKKERNGILETLLRTLGQDLSPVVRMTQRDRETVVKSFIKHTKDQAEKSKTAIQAMQEALAVSENDRRKLSESARLSSDKLRESLAKQEQLERENKKLGKEVQSLTEEMKTSREKATKLLAQVREDNQKEWLKREAMFKNTIRKLQKQLKAEQQRSKHLDGKESSNTSTGTTTQSKAIKVAPSFQVGGTIIRPVAQQPHPSYRPTKIPEPKTKSSEKKKKERQHRSSMIVAGIHNDENYSQRFPVTTSTMEGILQPKRMFGATNNRGMVELKSIMKKPSQQAGTTCTDTEPAQSCRAVHPIDAFKGGKTPSKNRAHFVRGNGGVKGLQDKLRLVRSPTFK